VYVKSNVKKSVFKLELFFPNLTVKEHIRKDDATLIIGCLSDNDIFLENDSMLVAHEGIAHKGQNFVIWDKGSRNRAIHLKPPTCRIRMAVYGE
jgi:hypothetical protein